MRRHAGIISAIVRSSRAALMHYINPAFAQETVYGARRLSRARYRSHVHRDPGTSGSWAGLGLGSTRLHARLGLLCAEGQSDRRGLA